jgi:multiple sugar transport system ATP-binding protein
MGRAIVRNPKAFLMDEPLSNLDAKLRVQMRSEVARIQNRLNTTTVYVTHDQTEAMTLGDRVAIMLHGVLQQVDSPMNLYNHPGNLFVAGFIGSPGMNFLPATIDNGVAKLPMVDVKLPQEVAEKIGRIDGKKVIAGVRPEDFEAASHVPAETKGRGTTFQTKFDLVEAMGAEYYVHFGVKAENLESSQVDDLLQDQGGERETTDEGDTVVVARLNAESKAKTGEPTEVWIDATKMHFFDADSGKSLKDA